MKDQLSHGMYEIEARGENCFQKPAVSLVREVPYLIETYKAFHKKGFEIYGVSFDRSEEAWLKAIKEKELDWLHVSALKMWDNQARNDYAVNSIPANFLIDCSTGEIIATGLRGEEVKAKMEELLK